MAGESVVPLGEHNYGNGPREKRGRRNYSEGERKMIRSVHEFFIKLLKEYYIKSKTNGRFIDKGAAAMTGEATGVKKTTLYHIIGQKKPKTKTTYKRKDNQMEVDQMDVDQIEPKEEQDFPQIIEG